MFTLKTDAAELATAIAWIGKGTPKRQSYVAPLRSAHVSVTAAGLQLRATDFDLFWETTVAAENGAADGPAVLVNPAELGKLLKGSKGDATVTLTETSLEVVIGARTVRVNATADVDDFPEWPVFVATAEPASMDPADVKRVLVAAGNDATLPMLTGVKFDDGQMITTDRFRLARVDHAGGRFDALVPSGALKPFTVGKGGPVSVTYGRLESMDNPAADQMRIRAERDGRTITARVLDCQFPKWQHLIASAKDSATMIAEVRISDLLAAMAGVSVDLEFQSGGTITVTGRAQWDHSVVTVQTIAADIATDDGLPFTVRLATEYLTGALKNFTGDTVTVSASTSGRPVSLEAGADYHLVMPQRIPA